MRLISVAATLLAYIVTSTSSFADAQKWETLSDHNPVEDQTLTAFVLKSVDGEASIYIRCTSNTTFGDGHVGVFKDILIATTSLLDVNTTFLHMRIDDGPPLGEEAVVTTDYKGMVISDEEGMWSFYKGKLPDDRVDFRIFVPQLLSARKILVELPIFQSDDKIYEFDSAGRNPADVLRACDLQAPPKAPAERKAHRIRKRLISGNTSP